MVTLNLYFISFTLAFYTEGFRDEDGDIDAYSALGLFIVSDSVEIGLRILNFNLIISIDRVMDSKTKFLRNVRAFVYLLLAFIAIVINIVLQSFLPFLVAYGLYNLFQ